MAALVGFSFTIRFLGLTSFVEGVQRSSYNLLAITVARMRLGCGGGVEDVHRQHSNVVLKALRASKFDISEFLVGLFKLLPSQMSLADSSERPTKGTAAFVRVILDVKGIPVGLIDLGVFDMTNYLNVFLQLRRMGLAKAWTA